MHVSRRDGMVTAVNPFGSGTAPELDADTEGGSAEDGSAESGSEGMRIGLWDSHCGVEGIRSRALGPKAAVRLSGHALGHQYWILSAAVTGLKTSPVKSVGVPVAPRIIGRSVLLSQSMCP